MTPGLTASIPAFTPSLAIQPAWRMSFFSSSFLTARSSRSASSAFTNSISGIALLNASRITQETRSMPTFPFVTPSSLSAPFSQPA